MSEPKVSVVLVCDSCGAKQRVGAHIASMGCRRCGQFTEGGVVDNHGKKEWRPGWKGGWMYPEDSPAAPPMKEQGDASRR